MTYTSFMNGDRPAGGMYKPAVNDGVMLQMVRGLKMASDPPPWLHWQVYFAVDDTDAKLEEANELGAKTIAPPMDIPGVGRFAILEDPQGAAFAIIKLENPPT